MPAAPRPRPRSVANFLLVRAPGPPSRPARTEPVVDDHRGSPFAAYPLSLEDYDLGPDRFDLSRPKLGRLYDWRPVVLVDQHRWLATTHVVGVDVDTETWRLTSLIIGTLDRLGIETRDGLHGLGTPGSGALSPAMLDLVAATARAEGIVAVRTLPIDRYAPQTRGRWCREPGTPSEEVRMEQTRPIALDNLIRRNRHLIELGVARPDEWHPAVGAVEPSGRTPTLKNWWIIALRDLQAGTASLHLLGTRPLQIGGWITSPIVRIAPDLSLCRTQNSLYQLSQPAEALPPTDMLMAVARALREWGIDEEYGLDAVAPEEIAYTLVAASDRPGQPE